MKLCKHMQHNGFALSVHYSFFGAMKPSVCSGCNNYQAVKESLSEKIILQYSMENDDTASSNEAFYCIIV